MAKRSRRDFLKALGAGVASLTLGGRGAEAKPATARPNFLVIVADDLGWADVGYHGSDKIHTPNLDRIARQGIRLEHHYVHPVCTPTRAALLSGRYASRFGNLAPSNSRVYPPGTVTLASALKGIGYDTCITGKWHLGSKPEWGPRQHGFVRSYGSLAGGVTPYTHLYKKGGYSRTWHRNDTLIEPEQGHVTDLLTREALRYIEAERTGPFFILVAFTAVHVPIDEPERWVKHYDGKIDDPSRKQFAADCTHMDHCIGQMLDALERTGQRANTLVLFFSDNGGQRSWKPSGKYPGSHRAFTRLGTNLPLRGGKGTLYDGGIRVPALVQWPGVLPPRTVDAPVHCVDWMPTFTRLAGYQPQQDLQWDGRDVWPLLTGEETKPEPRVLYWKFVRGWAAIRHGDWKLIVGKDKPDQLFDMARDPNETKNLAKTHPEQVARLKALLAEQQKLDRPRPPAR